MEEGAKFRRLARPGDIWQITGLPDSEPMPIYEFYSPDTNKIYSFFARSLAGAKQIPRCPDKKGARMERMMSRFAVTGKAKEPDQLAGMPDPDDPRMERFMAEMESEMAGMDENNPDPKQLGRLMRKMAEASGQKLPGEMQEMLARLEKGEDPEALEEQFGDALEGMENQEFEGAARAILKARKGVPRRDPQLYEMSDYV
jgi:hypothetical protein